MQVIGLPSHITRRRCSVGEGESRWAERRAGRAGCRHRPGDALSLGPAGRACAATLRPATSSAVETSLRLPAPDSRAFSLGVHAAAWVQSLGKMPAATRVGLLKG